MNSREMSSIDEGYRAIIGKYTSECPVRLGQIAREFRVAIKVSSLPTGISGQIKREGDGYVIRVNRHEARERQRFTIAHELSHFLLHKDMIDSSPDGIKDNVLYRSGAPELIEYQANRLAADIVMPMACLKKTLHEDFKGIVTDTTIEILAARFQVSKAAMEIRLSTSKVAE